MTSEYDESAKERPLSQRELLTISADIHLGAVDIADKLAVIGEKQKTTYELTLYRKDIPLHAAPSCWKDVNQHLESVVIRYDGHADDDRFGLELRAYFDNRWTCVLSKPANVDAAEAFAGVATEHKSAFGPVDRSFGRPYPVIARTDEIKEFMSALVHERAYQAEQHPVSDPMDAGQATMIVDTIDHSIDADTSRTDTYQLEYDGDTYLIDCEHSDGRVTSVDICHVLTDDIVFQDGQPKELFHHIVARVSLSNFEQGIMFYTGSEEGYLPEDEVTDEMLLSLKETLQELNGALETPDTPVIPADTADQAPLILRNEERYGKSSPYVDESDEDGLDSTDSGA